MCGDSTVRDGERTMGRAEEGGLSYQRAAPLAPRPRRGVGAQAAVSAALIGPIFPSTDVMSACGSYIRPALMTSRG
jgi:hypothetical protein